MQWGNSATGVAYVRDPQNVAWVPVGRFDAQSWVPYVATGTTGGVETGDSTSLGPYASLAAGEGFAAGHAGAVSVRAITANDLPTVGATSAGITPIPTAAQAGHVLRPAGWSQLLQNFGVKLFAGANNYVWNGFPVCSAYRLILDISTSSAGSVSLQIGSSGAPQVTGYSCILHRGVAEDGASTHTTGMPLWINRGAAVRYVGIIDIAELFSNRYHLHGSGELFGSDFHDASGGFVTLAGPMDYIRIVTSAGTITSGQGKLLGL